jgi:hypothetical protein
MSLADPVAVLVDEGVEQHRTARAGAGAGELIATAREVAEAEAPLGAHPPVFVGIVVFAGQGEVAVVGGVDGRQDHVPLVGPVQGLAEREAEPPAV